MEIHIHKYREEEKEKEKKRDQGANAAVERLKTEIKDTGRKKRGLHNP